MGDIENGEGLEMGRYYEWGNKEGIEEWGNGEANGEEGNEEIGEGKIG